MHSREMLDTRFTWRQALPSRAAQGLAPSVYVSPGCEYRLPQAWAILQS